MTTNDQRYDDPDHDKDLWLESLPKLTKAELIQELHQLRTEFDHIAAKLFRTQMREFKVRTDTARRKREAKIAVPAFNLSLEDLELLIAHVIGSRSEFAKKQINNALGIKQVRALCAKEYCDRYPGTDVKIVKTAFERAITSERLRLVRERFYFDADF